ncbi:MAG: dienelactone hydrolase family protein [Anaerolineales bacterium]|nr:dienelactone hydrolase family protein [Anaerolineales bacterium]
MRTSVGVVFFLLSVAILSACQSATETPTLPDSAMLRPGDAIGEMKVVVSSNDKTANSMFNYCSPYVESKPVTLTFECRMPRSDFLFVGYGEIANSQDELARRWKLRTWKLTIDGNPVDLSAFGTLDVDLGKKIRVWNVALENIAPGSHVVRYEASEIENPQNVTDLTWTFIMTAQTISTSSPTSVSSPTLHSSPTETTPLAEPGDYPSLTSTVNVGMHPYKSQTTDFNFMFYVPNGYQPDHQQQMPVVLYLHGTSLRGDNVNKLRIGEFTAILQYEPNFPFLVVAPQLPSTDETRSWSRGGIPEKLFALLEEVQKIYSVDAKRIYLTGSSLGGGGTWEIGLSRPDYFAALIPVMGFYGYPFETPNNICDLKDVPVWAFHGEYDLTVPLEAEQGLVDALRACGGNAQITVYPGAGHDIDAQVYKTPELFEWMLAQSLD